jgi:hypothetical protein
MCFKATPTRENGSYCRSRVAKECASFAGVVLGGVTELRWVLSWPVSRHHNQKTRTSCRLVHVPLEDGLNVGPKNVRLRHYNSIKLCITLVTIYYFLWLCSPARAMASFSTRFLDHTQRRPTVGRTPVDERSARRRNLYLTTHITHNRQTSILPVEFEPTIADGERPKTYALDLAAAETGTSVAIHL